MVGSGLKKLAAENGLQVSNGVAYGSLQGYAVTMSEGAGWKRLTFALSFPDAGQKGLFMEAVNAVDTQKLYRVQQLTISTKWIEAVFHDNPGTMQKIQAFLAWFIPLLDQYGATKAGTCAECGMEVTGGCWKLINGVAYHMHESCAENVRAQLSDENENRKQEMQGSYGSGLIGALLGAIVGAVVWAIVLNMGYVASLVGFVIGFLAEKGYNLLRGKQGKGKVAILIVAVIFGVVLGTFGADVLTLIPMIAEGETYLTYSEIPKFLLLLLMQDAEYRSAVLSNGGMGLLFAALGVFALIRKTGQAVADEKFVDLK